MTRTPEVVTVDLLGRPQPVPRAPSPPFYCIACSNTHPKRCSRHGTRHCGRGGCALSGCDRCLSARVEAEKRQRRALISEARAAVNRLKEDRLAQLGATRGLSAEETRAELLSYAEREPRRALTAFAKEPNA